MVDLEVLGKQERQGHRNTLISNHSVADVERMKRVLGDADLIVRINPLNPSTKDELEAVIGVGATHIMLPMFRSSHEACEVSELIASRAGFIPLVETRDAAQEIDEISLVRGVSEIYIGLNDLHVELGCRFMFEPLANGEVERMGKAAQAAGLEFGFGGIARIGEGLLPGELVLAEHVRLNSSCVILSRTFHRETFAVSDRHGETAFRAEVAKLRSCERRLRLRSATEVEQDRLRTVELVEAISVRAHY